MAITAYFDDSGSHRGSEVVLWGGVIGYENQFEMLNEDWRDTLKEFGLSHFHMSECERGDGDYGNRASRDHITYRFREIIRQCGFAMTAAAVDIKDWLAEIGHKANELGAEGMTIGKCIMDAGDYAAARNRSDKLSLVFDKCQRVEDIIAAAMTVTERSFGRAPPYSFAVMKETPAIQAADMVAWEVRNHFVQAIRHGDAIEPRAHFRPLLSTDKLSGVIMRREQVYALRLAAENRYGP